MIAVVIIPGKECISVCDGEYTNMKNSCGLEVGQSREYVQAGEVRTINFFHW